MFKCDLPGGDAAVQFCQEGAARFAQIVVAVVVAVVAVVAAIGS